MLTTVRPFPLQNELSRVFYGIGRTNVHQILCRLQIPYRSRVEQLTEAQTASLVAFLSSPATADIPSPTPVVDPLGKRELLKDEPSDPAPKEAREKKDWGRSFLYGNEMKRFVNERIMHLYKIGTYRGKRCVWLECFAGG